MDRLSKSTLDCEVIQREAIGEFQRAIRFDRWCWPLADPDTLLPLSGLAEHDYGPHLPHALGLEFSGADFGAKHVLAQRANSAASLSAETGGDLARSPRRDEVMRPVGIGDVAAAACRDPLETFDVLCRAYALTQREREVVAAFLGGLAVFEKIGIHSRRELLATFNASGDRH
jgi:hypothetical protein